MFVFAVPLLLLGFVLTWFIKETPLRTSSGDVRRAAALLEVDFAEDSLIGLSDPALAVNSVEHADDGTGTGAQSERCVTVTLFGEVFDQLASGLPVPSVAGIDMQSPV